MAAPAPLSADEVAELAIIYFKEDDPRAEALFQQLFQMAPDHVRGNYTRGLQMAADKHYEEAIPHFKRALAGKPGDPDILVGLGDAYMENRQWADAETCYKQVIAKVWGDSRPVHQMGIMKIRQDDLKAAKPYLEQYLKLVPNAPDRPLVETQIREINELLNESQKPTPKQK